MNVSGYPGVTRRADGKGFVSKAGKETWEMGCAFLRRSVCVRMKSENAIRVSNAFQSTYTLNLFRAGQEGERRELKCGHDSQEDACLLTPFDDEDRRTIVF